MPRTAASPPVVQQLARLAELDAVARTRALTPGESAEREALEYRRYLRVNRLPDQIDRARDRLARLTATARMEGLPI